MKKKFTLIGLCLFASCGLFSCDNSSVESSIVNKYKASFECNGGSSIESFFTDVIAAAPVTNRNGYDFSGWFIDSSFSTKASFPYQMNQDTIFYAKWTHKEMDPAGTFVVSSKVGEEEAKAYVFGEYKEDVLDIRVNVIDNKVFNSFPSSSEGELNGFNDNFEIYVSPLFNENTGFDVNNTYRILNVPSVGFNVFKINNDKNFESNLIQDSGVLKTNESLYTFDADGFNGYGANISIPYSLLGLSSKEEAMDNMGVWFALRNTNGRKNSETHYEESTYLGSNKAFAWTYLNFDKDGALKRKNVDSILFGDSYVDTDFYRNFKLEFKNSSLFSCSKVGSKVSDWINEDNSMYKIVSQTKPNKVFINLGVNDVQSGVSIENVVKDLNTLFSKIYSFNDQVKIYWISSPSNFYDPNNLGSPNKYNEAFEEVRLGVERLNLPYLSVKDGNDFTNKEHASFLNDGLHLNLFTYAKISNWLKEQLGGSLTFENSIFGTSKDKMSSSPQVDLTQKDVISSTGFLDTFAFAKESGSDTSFAFKTKMKIGERNNNDPYTKFGIILKHGKNKTSDSKFYFIYIDNSGIEGSDRTVSVATFHQFGTVWGADWQFNEPKKEISKPIDASYDYKSSFIDLRLEKNDSSYTFYAGNMETPILTFEGDKDSCSVGVMSFNLPFEAKESSYLNN